MQLIIYCLENSLIEELKLFQWLKCTCSGKVRLNNTQLKTIGLILGYKSAYRAKRYLHNLIKRDWIGYNANTGIYYIRGYDRLRKIEYWMTRKSAVFHLSDLEKFKAWSAGAIYTYLYRLQEGRRYKEAAFKMGKASQPLYSSPRFLPIATTGLAAMFSISVAQASRLKTLADKAGYIEVKKNYEEIPVPVKSSKLFKEHAEANVARRVVVRKGKVLLQLIDTILPHIALSRRNSLKT